MTESTYALSRAYEKVNNFFDLGARRFCQEN
jgi:hypothetical protein